MDNAENPKTKATEPLAHFSLFSICRKSFADLLKTMKIKTIKSIFLVLILFSLCGVSTIFALPPENLVKELYQIHDQDVKGNKDRILSGKNRKMLDKFFDQTLADFIWKDLTTERDGVGVLDFDPFYNAQDFDIKNFSVAKAKINGRQATVIVKFTNSGTKESLKYQLVRQTPGWKISDIEYTDGSSLLGYFKDDAKNSN